MYICLGLLEQIGEDGVLRTCRIAPSRGDGAVVIDWLKEIDPNHTVPGAADIGPFRFYDFDECVLQTIESRPRGIISYGDAVTFDIEHRSVPIPSGPAYYALSPPRGFLICELEVNPNGCEMQNRVAILDREKNLMSIAFTFRHPERRGTLEIHGKAVRRGTLLPSDVSQIPGFTYYEFNKDALSFVDGMYQKESADIRATVTAHAEGSAIHRPSSALHDMLTPKTKQGFLSLITNWTFASGIALAVIGLLFIVVGGASADLSITLFGQSITTTHVGVATVFIGVVMVVMIVRRILKSFDKH